MNFKFKPHTVIMMVGPTGCGKTSVSERIRDEVTHMYPELIGQRLSSDEIRATLLGTYVVDKRDPRMQHVSKQAFSILLNDLKNLMSYPVSSELIIVDTTAMAKEFRDDVIALCKEKHYHLDVIVFDYKNQKEYYKYNSDSENSKLVVSRALKRFKSKVLPELRSRDFHRMTRIKERVDLCDITVEMEDWDFYKSHQLDKDKSYVVFGDVHGCLDELKDALTCIKEDDVPVLIGDFVDKGPKVKETIEFLYEHKDRFKFVLGNHENFLMKVLTGAIDPSTIDAHILSTYFDSLPLLQNDLEIRSKFLELCDLSRCFLKTNRFILTHAPCDDKYLGKIDGVSLRNQRNLQRRDDISTIEQLEPFKQQAELNFPHHVFGHIAFEDTFKHKNKIGIDTGCVEGNKLSFVHMFDRPYFKSVDSKLEKTNDLVKYIKEEPEFDFGSLTPRDRKRIFNLAKNKINFISGTVSPADKMDNDLESLEQALKYYKERGQETLIMQTKYMGSRCQIYLNMTSYNDSYAVSRNGYLIRGDLGDVYKDMYEKFKTTFQADIEMIIIDGELLPWSFLGEGLIDKHFYPVQDSLNHEMKMLIENDFHGEFGKVLKKYQESEFNSDAKQMKKQDLAKKYKQYETFKCVPEFDYIDPTMEIGFIQTFNEQMELYAKDRPAEFKPFNILKMIYTDGSEEVFDDNFKIIPFMSDEYRMVDLTSDNFIAEAKRSWNALVKDNTIEGIVLKPQHSLGEHAPFIKVRNPNYLTIVYGHDYKHEDKYQKLLKRKSIKRKMQTSIREFKIGYDMLKIPYNAIDSDNKEYKTLVAKMIGLEATEKELDPRL